MNVGAACPASPPAPAAWRWRPAAARRSPNGSTWSTSNAAPSAIRRPMHEGQHPRDLHEKGTRSSSPQLRQQVRKVEQLAANGRPPWSVNRIATTRPRLARRRYPPGPVTPRGAVHTSSDLDRSGGCVVVAKAHRHRPCERLATTADSPPPAVRGRPSAPRSLRYPARRERGKCGAAWSRNERRSAASSAVSATYRLNSSKRVSVVGIGRSVLTRVGGGGNAAVMSRGGARTISRGS